MAIVDARPTIPESLRDAWRCRRMVPWLGVRVLVKMIAGTKLGRFWLVLRPLMDTLGKALIFGALLRVATPNGIPYLIFLMTGLVVWRSFERVAFFATRSFDLYRKLMSTLKFPLLLVPLASAAFPAVEVGVYVVILTGVFTFYWLTDGTLYLHLGPETLMAVAGLLIALAISAGVGLWTSVLNGKARDVRLSIRYVLEFWLFLTPVIYPLSVIPPGYRDLASINPMVAPVEMSKLGVLGVGQVELFPLLWSLGFTVLLLLSGLWFFNREAVNSVDRHSGPADDEEDDF